MDCFTIRYTEVHDLVRISYEEERLLSLMSTLNQKMIHSDDVFRSIETNMAMIRFDRQRRVVDVNDTFA